MNMTETLSKELAERFRIESCTTDATKDWEHSMVSCAKRIQETSDVTVKVHNEQTVVQERMQTLLENDARLKTTFAEIDEIERIVNHVKETYNKVAESVDDMEKAINASISSGFPFLQKRNETVQPYFPPPLPVNIYHTKDLFSTSTTPQPQPPLSSSPSSSSLSIKE